MQHDSVQKPAKTDPEEDARGPTTHGLLAGYGGQAHRRVMPAAGSDKWSDLLHQIRRSTEAGAA